MTLHVPSREFVSGVPVTVRPDLFSQGVKRHVIPQGLTLAEIAAAIELPVTFWEHGVIAIGGHEVPKDRWHLVTPKVGRDGQQIAVTFYMVPAGGKGMLAILAQAAITIGTFGLGLVNPLLGSLFGIGASVLMQMLFPPPQPKKPKQPRDAVSYGIQGNPAKPLEQLDRVLGRVTCAPPYLAQPYSTLDSQDVYVEAVVGLAGNHEVSKIKVNGTDMIENGTIIDYQVREGDPSDTPITIANYSAFEERPGLQLTRFDLREDPGQGDILEDQVVPSRSSPVWHSFDGRGEGDKITIRLLFPSNLIATTEGTEPDIDPLAVPIRLQFRRNPETEWTNGPEFHVYNRLKIAQETRVDIKLIWATGGAVSVPNIDVFINAFGAYWHASPGETWEWIAHSYFDPSDGSLFSDHIVQGKNGFELYLDPAVFPRGEYEIRIKRGVAYNASAELFNSLAYTYVGSAARAAFFEYQFSDGFYRVKTLQAGDRFSDQIVVDAFQTLSYEYPLPLASEVPLTLIALKVKNGNINSIAAQFWSRVNAWDGVDWSTYEPSSNPAALYRHVLLDDLNAKPIDPTIFDTEAVEDWYDILAANGRECNAVFSGTVEEALKLIAAAGFAVPRQNEKWGVIVERDRSAESIVQNFTPLNSRGFSADKPFADIPHAIYAEFIDETHEYTQKSRTIYGDGYDALTATLFQTVQYEGITHPEKIDERALFDWRQMRWRQTKRSIEIGAESLLSQRGDLVGMTHDVVGTKFFYGIVDAVLTSGGNVTGLRLEATAELSQAGGACGVMVRYEDGSILEAPINETTDTSVITFVTPFAIPAELKPGCLVAAGLVSHVYKRMLISDIRPGRDLTARVTLVDEAPEVFSGSGLSLDFSQAKNSQYLASVM